MISFLNPWFWLGLAALSAPLWLHLRRKPETNVQFFSTLRFLEDCPRPRQSPRRLQNLLLLALRILGLVLLIGAFAWPYLAVPERTPVEESRVYVLDNTLSRQADPTWTEQRDRIVRELEGLNPASQAAVILLENQPRVLAGFGDDPALAIKQLRELEPSFQRGPYLAALRQAKGLLDRSLGERKQILLLTDSQNNQWTEHAQTPPFLREGELICPANRATNAPNLALSDPQADRIYLGERSLVNFTVRLARHSMAPEARVVLKANGQVIFDRAVELADKPELVTLAAQWEADPELWLEGEAMVAGAPDALAADNRVYFVVPPIREGRVAVLAQSQYVRLAFSPEIMRGRWNARFLDAAQLDQEIGREGDEVLIVESGYLQSSAARRLVSFYLTNRRGVLLLVNRLSPAIHGALRELGFVPRSADPILSSREKPIRFGYLQERHPVLQPFLAGDYGKLLEVEVHQHYALDSADAFPLVISETGQGMLFQGTQFPGVLFVLSFGMDRAQTSWPVHPTFIPFLDLCLQNARPRTPDELDYLPGELAQLTLPETMAEAAVTDSTGRTANQTVSDGRLRLRLADQPGFYRIGFPGRSEPEKVFAVNPSPKESVLLYDSEPEALDLWQSSPTAPALPSAVTATGPSPSLRTILSQRFWWWLLVVGLAILLLEMAWTAAKPRPALSG